MVSGHSLVLGYCSRSYIIVTDNLTKIIQLNCLISNLTKLFFAKLYKRICPLLLRPIIGIGYYINFQQYVSVICAISDCYYHGAEPAFSSSRPLLFLFPSPSLLRSGPLIYSYLGSEVSSAGAEPRPTTHYVPVKLLIEAGSLIAYEPRLQ